MINLLVCRSGGKTSEYMYKWLLENKRDEYNIVGVFANTSWEHKKTIEFVNNNDIDNRKRFGVEPVWVEAVTHKGRVACTHKTVTYDTCSQNMEVFTEVVKKYGLPNKAYPHCTRELKENPIHDYIKSIGWVKGDYQTALGIRIDEPKRLKYNSTIQNKIYPLVDMHPEQPDKLDIIDWWEDQVFQLGIPEHLGNCVGCFKKSKKKQLKAYRDSPEQFKNELELMYGHIGPNKINGEHSSEPRTMYRQYMTNSDVIALFKVTPVEYLMGDEYEGDNEGCSESCEPFTG